MITLITRLIYVYRGNKSKKMKNKGKGKNKIERTLSTNAKTVKGKKRFFEIFRKHFLKKGKGGNQKSSDSRKSSRIFVKLVLVTSFMLK